MRRFAVLYEFGRKSVHGSIIIHNIYTLTTFINLLFFLGIDEAWPEEELNDPNTEIVKAGSVVISTWYSHEFFD